MGHSEGSDEITDSNIVAVFVLIFLVALTSQSWNLVVVIVMGIWVPQGSGCFETKRSNSDLHSARAKNKKRV